MRTGKRLSLIASALWALGWLAAATIEARATTPWTINLVPAQRNEQWSILACLSDASNPNWVALPCGDTANPIAVTPPGGTAIAPPTAFPTTIAASGQWLSGIIPAGNLSAILASVKSTQAGVLSIQRYADNGGLIPIGTVASQTLVASTLEYTSINDGVPYLSYQVKITNTGGSTATISNAAILQASGAGSSSGGGGGGGAVTVASGADQTEGSIGDASSAQTLDGYLNGIFTKLNSGTVSVSASSLPLPTGAASQTTLASVLTALGSPFQAGGSFGNTSFALNAGTAYIGKVSAVDSIGADATDTANHAYKVNCVVGCAGGTFNNNADALATSSTNGQAAAWLYGYNGSTWDRLRDDVNKYLYVDCAAGCSGVAQGTSLSGLNGSLILDATQSTLQANTAGQANPPIADIDGVQVNRPFAPTGSAARGTGVATASTAAITMLAASGSSSLYEYITNMQCGRTDAGTTAIVLTLNDSASSIIVVPAGGGNNPKFDIPLRVAKNTAATFTSGTSVSSVYCNAQGYYGP